MTDAHGIIRTIFFQQQIKYAMHCIKQSEIQCSKNFKIIKSLEACCPKPRSWYTRTGNVATEGDRERGDCFTILIDNKKDCM